MLAPLVHPGGAVCVRHFQNEAFHRGGSNDGDEDEDGDEGAASFGGFEREGQFGPGLSFAQDDFLLLLLLLLTVLLQLHALLVNLSLLLNDT